MTSQRVLKGARLGLIMLLLPLTVLLGMFPSGRAQTFAPSFTFTVAGDYAGISGGTCGTDTVDSCGRAVANTIAASSPRPDFHIALGTLATTALIQQTGATASRES